MRVVNDSSGKFFPIPLLHSEWPKLTGVLAILSAIGLNNTVLQIRRGNRDNFPIFPKNML